MSRWGKQNHLNQPFITGLQLSQLLYTEAVQPLLAAHFPDLPYSAGLLGAGSEVLGFDTSQSTDHDWGPRLLLFLTDADEQLYREPLDQMLRQELPAEIHGFETSFETADHGGVSHHGVKIFTVRRFFNTWLNYDPTHPPRVVDWLTFPQQILRTVTAGQVFHDGLGQLERIRGMLHYYPHEVWLYLMACQWRRIGQEEAFMGRCGQVGDELGSQVVAARLVRDLMGLCFLLERQYVPYIKWFGTAFAHLACATELSPILRQVLSAPTWPDRETHLSVAYAIVADMHNRLSITEPQLTQVSSYYNRPFLVIHADNFADALRAAIRSEEVRTLPAHLGSVDQFVDSTDVLSNPTRFKQLKIMFE